ncbi:amidase [Aquabacter sp. L1I39]|nr:amidase [Aquabacter sp. L1I39]
MARPAHTLTIGASSSDDLCNLSAVAAVDLLGKGEISPLDLVDAAIARVETVDGRINALPLRRFEAARHEAKAFSRVTDGARGWLAGLPIAVKDYNDVAGLPTTCGSPLFKNAVAATSDAVVQRLEARGALVLAKSNVPEFAGANTFNPVFGATANPWRTDCTAGGSSGGSAAALAAGMVWLATGNDLGGSLRIPASYCGIVGMRPSAGRVPRPSTLVPFDPLWVEGPMGRSVADVALMLDAGAYESAGDPLSFSLPGTAFLDAARAPRAPRRVAFSADLGLGPVEGEVADLCAAAVACFADVSASVEEAHPDFSGAIDAFQVLRAHLVATVRGPLLDAHRDAIAPHIVWNIEKGLTQTGADMAAADRRRGALIAAMADFFVTYDILACPTVALAPFPLGETYPTRIGAVELTSYIDWMYLTFVLTLTGCPVISVPVGMTGDGRPVGLQLVGRPRGDLQLIEAAALLEQILGPIPGAARVRQPVA